MATGFDKFLSKPLPTTVKPTEHGLRTIIRRWEISAEALRVANADTNAFPAYETADVEYTSALLVEQSTGDGTAFGVKLMYWRVYQELPADNETLVQLGKTVFSTTENGLQTAEQRFVARAGHVLTGDVGADTGGAGTDVAGLYLSGNGFAERGRVSAVVVKRWAESGILNAKKEFGDDLLYVTFESQGTKFIPTLLRAGQTLTGDPLIAFTGGASANIYKDDIRNVNGFRRYITTVMMRKDGSKLQNNAVVRSFEDWDTYNYPGSVNTSFNAGIVPYPGSQRTIRVLVEDRLSTSASVGLNPPFSIKAGAYAWINYIPTATGIAESMNKAFGQNYLIDAMGVGAGGNTTFLGMDVSNVIGGGSSDPTYSQFLQTANPILSENPIGEFTTDEGVTWHRIRKITLIGTFDDY